MRLFYLGLQIGTAVAALNHMTHRDLTQRYLLSSLGLLFVASVGAFLLYVPMLTAIAVATILAGMICMFLLGFIARGSRRRQNHPPQALTTIHPPDSKILYWPKTDLPARVTELRPTSPR